MIALTSAASKWKLIGVGFRLKSDKLDKIQADFGSPEECLLEVLKEWVHKNYNYARFGEPSWRKVVMVVASPSGGNNTALALSIAKEHLCKLQFSLCGH